MEYVNLTKDDLNKLKKPELFDVTMKLKEFTSDLLMKFMVDIKSELKSVKERLGCLSEENKILKELLNKKNDEDKHHNKELERASYDAIQYIRRNNIEISGIPELFNENLEEKVIDICKEYDVHVNFDDIEACHRLPKNKRHKDLPPVTIVRFVNRRKAESLLKNKNKNVDVEKIGIPIGTKNFFNDNLCPYYRNLWFKCRKLKQSGLIKYVWSKNGIVRIRRDEVSPVIRISHLDDISDEFPDFDFNSS